MDRKGIEEAIRKCLEDKGKRKFLQSVEVAINFKGVDFSKPENRLNVDVVLPHGRGREVGVVAFADGQLALDVKKAGASVVISSDEIPKLAGDKKRLKTLYKNAFIAQPSLMAVVGKHLGQKLAIRDKMPKPITGSVEEAIKRAKKSVVLKTKGKYLPVVHCLIGSENMSVEQLADNLEAVLDAVKKAVGEGKIRSAYVKLTMGKPHRVF
ncbi:MAG: 50S ribosomal protein L1 [Candidatus Micrarchaeia archaeon]